jgi:hypothetical protein
MALKDIQTVASNGDLLTIGGGTRWQSYTPTLTNGTNITATGWWRRNGSNMELYITVTATGAGSGAGLRASIPSGQSIDTSITIVGQTVGAMRFLDSGVLNYTGVSQVGSATTLAFQRNAVAPDVQGSDFTINDAVIASASVPIVGW